MLSKKNNNQELMLHSSTYSYSYAIGCTLAMQLYCQFLSALLFLVSPGEGCHM